MTDAERTSAQAEEQEQTTQTGGLFGKIVGTARSAVETVAETAREVVEAVAERTPDAVAAAAATAGSAASAVVEKVRKPGDAPAGQALTAAVEQGGAETPETRPVAVVEAAVPEPDTASPEQPAAPVADATPPVPDIAVAASETESGTTGAVEQGGTETPETRPVAAAETVVPELDTASPEQQTAPMAETVVPEPDTASPEQPAAQVADAAPPVTDSAMAAPEAQTGTEEPAPTPSPAIDAVPAAVVDAATAVRQRVARAYEALVGPAAPAAPADAQSEPPAAEAGATYQPPAEGGARSGRPRRFKDVQPGMQLQGKVTSIALYGIFVDIGVGRDGLVHISEMSDKRIESPTEVVEIGSPVDVWVKSVDPDARRISLTMRDPNRPKPERVERRGPRRREINRERLAEIKVGDNVEGVISSLAPFGAFVDLGVGKDGLVHVSELAEGRVERPEDAVTVGERYTFKVLEVDPEGNRISLSLRRAQRTQRMQQLESGVTMDGTISGIAPFGAFVDIGVGRDGLVHVSELSSERVTSVEEVVKVGDKVQVKVIEVDPNSKRISLTMRVDEPLPDERPRPAPRAPSGPAYAGEMAPPPRPAPAFGGTPAYGGPPPFDEGRSDRGARRGTGGRDSGRERGSSDFGRGEGRVEGRGRGGGGDSRRDRGGGRSGGGRGDAGRGRREGQVFEPAQDVYTFEDPEEETFTGDATLEDLLSKFNSGKRRDKSQSREEEDDDAGAENRAAAIRRTLALRDEE